MKNKALNALGLAQRAGKCVTGDELNNSISKKKVSLVLIAHDASERTQTEISKQCEYYDIEMSTHFNKNEISQAIGKYNRVAVGISDNGLANLIKTYLKDMR